MRCLGVKRGAYYWLPTQPLGEEVTKTDLIPNLMGGWDRIFYVSEYQQHQKLFRRSKDSATNKVAFPVRVVKYMERPSLGYAVPGSQEQSKEVTGTEVSFWKTGHQWSRDRRPSDILFSEQDRTQLRLPKEPYFPALGLHKEPWHFLFRRECSQLNNQAVMGSWAR